MQAPDLAGKRVELLREALPGLRHLAIMGEADYGAAVAEMVEVEAAARTLGLDATRLEIKRVQDIASAVAALSGSAGALYVCAGPFASSNTLRISTLALGARLPTIYPSRLYLADGGSCHMGQAIRTFSAVPPKSLTRSCAEQNRAKYRWSSRLNSNLW